MCVFFQRLGRLFACFIGWKVHELNGAMGEDKFTPKVVKGVQQSGRKSNSLNLAVSLEVVFDSLKGPGCSTAGQTGSRQVENEVKLVAFVLELGDGDATAVAVKSGPDSTQASQKGRNKVFGFKDIKERCIPQSIFLIRIGGLSDAASRLSFHGRFGFSGVLGHQIVVHVSPSG
tara:strand:- start:1858 stop:2379 length:522 start_codon:yes stop_codon:yes gene_type:complete